MGRITKSDIKCYRTNYEKSGWLKINETEDKSELISLPTGILDAVEILCDEIERLNGWKKNEKGNIK